MKFDSEYAKVQSLTTENHMLHEQLAAVKISLNLAEKKNQELEGRLSTMLHAMSNSVPTRKVSRYRAYITRLVPPSACKCNIIN